MSPEMITGRLAQVASSGYVRAVATLSTGQFIGAAIPLLAAPILGRLYLPADYGPLATYMSIAQVLGVISTFQLQHGVIAERDERRAEELVEICRWTSLVVAVIAGLIVVAAFVTLAGTGSSAAARGWMLALPATTLASGMTGAIIALANRRQRYGKMARLGLYQGGTAVTSSLALGFLNWGPDGLIASYLLGQAVSASAHYRLYREMVPHSRRSSMKRCLALFLKHQNFVRYTLPSELIGMISMQMPVFALSTLGALPLLGGFTRAYSLVAAPLSLVGSSIAQVFRQNAAQQYRAIGSCWAIYSKTLWTLLAIGAPSTIILMAFGPELFLFVLGPKWGEAGEIARILAPMLLLRLVCNPLATVFIFQNRQREDFSINLASTALLFFLVAFALLLSSPRYVILAYTISYTLTYAAYLGRSWRIARQGSRNQPVSESNRHTC